MTSTPKPEALASLVERLREWASVVREADKQWSGPLADLLEEAAFTIDAQDAGTEYTRGTMEGLAAERDALREALAECRRAVSGGKSNPRQTVRNIVDMAIEERGRCAILKATGEPK